MVARQSTLRYFRAKAESTTTAGTANPTGLPQTRLAEAAQVRFADAAASAGYVDGDWKSLGRAPWVLNPPGCPLRASLIDRMERAGFTPMIEASVHNMHMQLAFVQSGYGVGLLPARFIARNR